MPKHVGEAVIGIVVIVTSLHHIILSIFPKFIDRHLGWYWRIWSVGLYDRVVERPREVVSIMLRIVWFAASCAGVVLGYLLLKSGF